MHPMLLWGLGMVRLQFESAAYSFTRLADNLIALLYCLALHKVNGAV